MAKHTSVSGFPEWTPAQRRFELSIIDRLRERFELYAFEPIETRAIEPLSVLLQKGDDKEIYTLGRLHDAAPKDIVTSSEEKPIDQAPTKIDGLGLHFDLTVPFSRYVQELKHLLTFPFKRYQIQKVWRGERPQEGRYREFYQCDMDIVALENLPIFYDAEMALLLLDALSILPIPPVVLFINNRKVLQGFYQEVGIVDIAAVLRVVDKMAKIGAEKVKVQLTAMNLTESQADAAIGLAGIRGNGSSVIFAIQQLAHTCGIQGDSELLQQGLRELREVSQVVEAAWSDLVSSCDAICLECSRPIVELNLSIARGLDYYTGTVYEGYIIGEESFGAICSGGRYDNLVNDGRQAMPGLGVSIGLTRLMGYIFNRQPQIAEQSASVDVFIILNEDSARFKSFQVAQILRSRKIRADVCHRPMAFGKQIKIAEKRGARYVCFLNENTIEIKNLTTGVQEVVDLDQWQPDLHT
ncbi:MAG: histidine--tRNA ligase [Pseudomonadota bacterium]